MKTIAEYNEIFNGKMSKRIECKNGRTYFLFKIEESDWLYSFTSKRTDMTWDDEKRMVYRDFDKFLRAVKRIQKMAVK